MIKYWASQSTGIWLGDLILNPSYVRSDHLMYKYQVFRGQLYHSGGAVGASSWDWPAPVTQWVLSTALLVATETKTDHSASSHQTRRSNTPEKSPWWQRPMVGLSTSEHQPHMKCRRHDWQSDHCEQLSVESALLSPATPSYQCRQPPNGYRGT